jgi:polyphosphate glucokinase
MTNASTALGLDIGGSSIKAAVVDLATGRLLTETDTITLPKPPDPDKIVPVIVRAVNNHHWTGPVGVGFPGIVKNGRVFSAANLTPAWLQLDLLSVLSNALPQPVSVINDADAAGLAEMRFGAGTDRNCSGGGSVLILTLGTGIGSALFRDGVLYPNTEFGHIELDGVDAETNAAASVRTRLGLDWPDWGARLNCYLQKMEFLLSPDRIILGGGVSENFDKFSAFLALRAEVRVAALSNTAGLIGATLSRFKN